MNYNIQQLQENLCNLMCSEIKVEPKNDKLLRIQTPFYFSDGDPYQIYIKEMAGGIMRVTDMGHTLLQLSYENDVDKFREGTRGILFGQILSEFEIKENNGEFFTDTDSKNLVTAIFGMGQALTKITDLTFLNRARAESTFYEDLNESLFKIVTSEKIQRDYIFPGMDNGADYPIDYYIEGKNAPLYVFGIPNKDKARLTNIILEHLLRSTTDFDSLLIFANQENIPRPDLARLSNTGGEMIASLDATDDFKRKLLRKVA
ncbi:MAG: DUF1828 domain-containing protein [Ginsengibacter sp.]